MMLETEGKRYLVERDFAKDRFVVRDLETNRDISARFEPDLAANIL